MPRIARIIAPGRPHHVTQRGTRRYRTFFGAADYAEYLDILRDKAERYAVDIWAYCLMPNHIHLIAVPETEEGLRRAIGTTHQLYSQRLNHRQRWKGHVWQGRFFSFPLSENHVLTTARYIELNPVRAKLAWTPEEWPWSSALAHVEGRLTPLLKTNALLERCPNWRELLQEDVSELTAAAIDRHSVTGLPFGDKDFVTALESAAGRPLSPRPRGRPPKNRDTIAI